jgi:hypothetical protein
MCVIQRSGGVLALAADPILEISTGISLGGEATEVDWHGEAYTFTDGDDCVACLLLCKKRG